MVSNKVLLGRAGGVIRGSGFSKYRESHAYNLLYAHAASPGPCVRVTRGNTTVPVILARSKIVSSVPTYVDFRTCNVQLSARSMCA